MAQTDAFALKNSGLNEFLFANVGTELNGSPLTLLSTLARLGKDPWAQAAEWAGMPAAAAITALTRSILQMPLCPRAIDDAATTSARLVLLLPRKTDLPTRTGSRKVSASGMPDWLPGAATGIVLALLVAVATFAALSTTPATPAAVEQTLGLAR